MYINTEDEYIFSKKYIEYIDTNNWKYKYEYEVKEQEQEDLSKKKLIYKASKKKQRQYNHHNQKMIKAQLNYKNKRNKCKNR